MCGANAQKLMLHLKDCKAAASVANPARSVPFTVDPKTCSAAPPFVSWPTVEHHNLNTFTAIALKVCSTVFMSLGLG